MSGDCPHCRRFRAERDEALEALRQAEDAAGLSEIDDLQVRLQRLFKLRPQSARLAAILYASRTAFVPYERLARGVFARFDDLANWRAQLHVQMYFVKQAGLRYLVVWGQGLVLDPRSRADIAAKLEARA